MRHIHQARLLLGTIAITSFGAIYIIILAAFSASPPSEAIQSPTQTISTSPSRSITQPILETPAVSVTPSNPMPYVIVTNPTVPVGGIIELPSELYLAGNMSLRRTNLAAQLSVDEALGAIQNPWQKGGQFDGKLVTVTATFGLGTMGHQEPDGTWVGFLGFPEFNCTAIRKCIRTGKMVERIENRPMWVLDYKNLPFYGTGVNYNHTVYTVDDNTGIMIYGWGYSEP